MQNKERGWMGKWYVLGFTYHMVYILWLSSWNMIKQQWVAREELLEVLDGSGPESRAACSSSREIPRGKAPDFRGPIIWLSR